MEIRRDHLRAAVELQAFDDEGARVLLAHAHRHRYPRPEKYRDAAVLMPFYPAPDGLRLVLSRRANDVEHHRGQISFPGGAREEGESLLQTALREAGEEMGIRPGEVEILGRLTPLQIPVSGFEVHPFVGWLSRRPDYRLDAREVIALLEPPLELLLDPSIRREREVMIGGRIHRVPVFDLPDVAPPPLWGATAMMLSGYLERLRAVLQRTSSSPSADAPK